MKPRSYKEQPISRVSPHRFIGSWPWVIEIRRQTAPHCTPDCRDRQPWLYCEFKISASYQNLHCIETHASARLVDVFSSPEEFNQGFSTFLLPARFGSPCTCTRVVSTSTTIRLNFNLQIRLGQCYCMPYLC